MARKKKHEEHQNHEAWAIPYGDLVTLLFALFTVMYAMSSVNEGKYRILSDSLVAAFRGAPTTATPISVGAPAKGKGGDANLSGVSPTTLMKLRDPRPLSDVAEEQDRKAREAKGLGAGAGVGTGQPGDAKAGDPAQALFYMADEVRKALKDLIDQNQVQVRQNALSLEVEIRTDILFPSGVAQVATGAIPVVEQVGAILKPFPNQIRVEGHTDNRPISTAVFPSNWELSAARAANVVQLFSKAGVEPKRMEVLGLGENRPVASNDTVEGRNANRRVIIVVLQGEQQSQAEVAKAIQAPAAGAGLEVRTVLAPGPDVQRAAATGTP